MKNIMGYLKEICEEKQEAALQELNQGKVYHWRQNILPMKTEYDKGLNDGIEVGLIQGVKQGSEKARVQLREEIAEKLLNFGLNATDIFNITGVMVKEASNS